MPSTQPSIIRRVAASGAILGTAWLFHSQAITPIELRARESGDTIASLRERLDSAKSAIGETRNLEQHAGNARAALRRLIGQRADNPVMVSFPDSLKDHFSRFGLRVPVIRLGAAVDEPGLPGYQRVYWSMAVPVAEADRNVTGLLLAVAELEMQERFIKVVDFAIQPDVEDARLRMANINVATLAPK